jgi:hypothetical protein
MFIMNLKERISGKVKFLKFINNEAKKELWYKCEDGFEFPIPLSDTDGAEFKDEDKGMFFMRWIRKHMSLIKEAQSFSIR